MSEAVTAVLEQTGLDWWTPRYNVGAEMLKAIRLARSAMGRIETSGRNTYDNYEYSSMRDYVEGVEKGLAEYGLSVIIEVVTPQFFKTGRDKLPTGCHSLLQGHLYHESGQSLPFQFLGEAFDRADKASYKATTGGRKYALTCLFNLKAGTDPESDESVSKAADAELSQRNPYREQKRDREPERPAEPPQENPVEKAINARPTAAELASYLLTLTGKHPVKENAQRWKEIGVAVKKRLESAGWEEPQQATVEAVLEGVRAQLKPAAQPASSSVPDSATPPATEAKGDPSKAPSFERLAGWVDQMESPAALADVVTSLESSVKFVDLRANPVAMAKAVVYALDKLNRHTDDQSWPFDECSKAGQVIIAIRDKYALDADSIETFGGGPDSATPAAAAAG